MPNNINTSNSSSSNPLTSLKNSRSATFKQVKQFAKNAGVDTKTANDAGRIARKKSKAAKKAGADRQVAKEASVKAGLQQIKKIALEKANNKIATHDYNGADKESSSLKATMRDQVNQSNPFLSTFNKNNNFLGLQRFLSLEDKSSLAMVSKHLWSDGGLKKFTQAHNYLQSALSITENMTDSAGKSEALSTIAIAQAKTGDFASAYTTLERIDDDTHISNALLQISIEQIKTGDIAGALRTGRRTNNPNIKTVLLSLLSEAVAQHARVGNFTTALNIARDIPDNKYKSTALSTIATEKAKTGNIANANSLFKDAITTALSIQNPNDKTVAVREVIFAQVDVGDIDGVRSALNDIGESSGLDQFEIFATSAAAEAKAGNHDDTIAILNDAKSAALRIEDYVAKSEALNKVVDGQIEAGDLEGAQGTLKTKLKLAQEYYSIRDPEKSQALSDIAIAQNKAGDYDGARETLQRALPTTRGHFFSYVFFDYVNIRKDNAFSVISNAYVKIGDFDAAREIHRNIISDHLRYNLNAEIAIEQAKAASALMQKPS